MEKFNFYQITDLHYYANEEIGSYGKHFDLRCGIDQKCVAESGAIIDAAFAELAADKDNEIVIISGDLTYDGEKISHDLLLKKLQKLKDAGKRIFVTFATHDFDNNARGYTEIGEFKLEEYTRAELREHYKDFGWSEAVSEHVPSYSYAVKMVPGWRFLLLNDDGDGRSFCGYDDTLIDWIKNQAKEAEREGERVIAVTHHPMLPPGLIYPLFSHRDMLGGYEIIAPMFADLGIQFCFTGHTHMQSVTCIDTALNNRLYHVNTGSIAAYPAPYRKMTVTEKGIDVKTYNLGHFDWDLRGRTAEEHMKEHFLFMIKDIFDSMENDIEHFKQLAKGFSMDEKTVDALKPLLKILGKIVNGLTFKSLGRLLFVSSKIDPMIENVKVRDFLMELVINLYSGVKRYTPDTVEYKAFMAIVSRIPKAVKLKDHFGNPVEISDVVEDLLYDKGEFDNTNTFLPFKEVHS